MSEYINNQTQYKEKIKNILKLLHEGKDVFWIQMKSKFIHIRYFALRDKNNDYKGVLEVSQDITNIRSLSGEKRL